MKPENPHKLIAAGLILLFILACNVLAPLPASTLIPSPIPPPATSTPLLSQQVTLIPQALNETNQTPPFTITSQTPQLAGSGDLRVSALNQRLNQLVAKEVDTFRQSFLQNAGPTVSNGSFLEATYTLLSQYDEIWSFKFNFSFYSDGAAHPGSYSLTLSYDLGQGGELMLADLFLSNSNYLQTIADYCTAELSSQPFFEGPLAEGTQPTLENYRNWNITPDGLMITFDEYQVAPYAAGAQTVIVPYGDLQVVIDPRGPLKAFLR